MKICTKCKQKRELSQFLKDKSKKDGLSPRCKFCLKEYREKNKQKRKQYNEENKHLSKQYYLNNRDNILKKQKTYYINNQDKIKLYRKKNKDKFNKDFKLRKENYPLFKLSCNIRSLIYQGLKGNKLIKTKHILGCSFEKFKVYLEQQFESWMSWENYGVYTGNFNEGWDIDHKIPISNAQSEEDLYKLNHYTNLQPLCSYKNRFIKINNENYQS